MISASELSQARRDYGEFLKVGRVVRVWNRIRVVGAGGTSYSFAEVPVDVRVTFEPARAYNYEGEVAERLSSSTGWIVGMPHDQVVRPSDQLRDLVTGQVYEILSVQGPGTFGLRTQVLVVAKT